jgi:dihydrodipicolinate synthase/N-acetylneuraminate lyase
MGAESTPRARARLLEQLFPAGIPRLWCPPLTHYTPDGDIDQERMTRHLAFLTKWAKGLLVPGSTGDGWELTEQESGRVIDLSVRAAEPLGVHVLIAALHPRAERAKAMVRRHNVTRAAVGRGPICGFAVCPPRGVHLSQEEMRDSLASLLELGPPLALYQLPQVTENEMGPELVAGLAQRFAHLILFKDTSGSDAVARSGLDLGGVFLVRGMEGEYAYWLKANSGPYDGLLLASANSFGRELSDIIQLSDAGRPAEAERLAQRLSSLISVMFRLVADLSYGNAFANAAKAVDHLFAYGPNALAAPAPRVHAGPHLSRELLTATREALRRHELLPSRGYLD